MERIRLGEARHGGRSAAVAGAGLCIAHLLAAVDGVGDGFLYRGSGFSGSIGAWGGPTDATCVSPSFCVATEGGGFAMWNGSSWSQPQDQDPVGQLQSVSCTNPSFCVAGDSAGNVLAWNGSRWTAPQTVDPASAATSSAGNALVSTSCVGTAFCVLVDTSGRAIVYNGAAWSAPEVLGHGNALTSVSCASSAFCVATDGAGNAYQYH